MRLQSLQSLLSTLRRRLTPLGRERAPLRLQYLGMSDADLLALRQVLDGVARRLGLRLALDAHGGDIVVVERAFVSHVSTQALRAYCEDRPMVAIDMGSTRRDPLDSSLERFEERQQDLLGQLREVPLVRLRAGPAAAPAAAGTPDEPDARSRVARTSPFESGFDAGFDSRLDDERAPALTAGHQRIVEQLLQGRADPSMPRLWLGYGPGACMEVDFGAAQVRMDPEAEQRLRIGGELPSYAPPGAVPGPRAVERELDQTLWDLGMACGDHGLLRQPNDWWHTPLGVRGAVAVDRYTRMPRHRVMGRRLEFGPATPSELRRHALVSVRELRKFVQACLFLGLVDWEPTPQR
jgi:hypothetical protein